MNTIDHSTLTQLVEAGAVRDAHVVGRSGGWSVHVRYGTGERTLVAQRSRQMRVFRRMEALVAYLKTVGIERFDVDAATYQAEGGKAHVRPDRAEALRHAHEAAVYGKWFRSQVEGAVQEADNPKTEWAPHGVVKQDMARQRAKLLMRIEGGDE